MKKGVAVPYIIAILLGIAVIGLIGYWFFVSGGKFGASAEEQRCRTAAAQWCTQFSLQGYAKEWFDANKFTVANPDCVKYKLITENDEKTAKSSCTGLK